MAILNVRLGDKGGRGLVFCYKDDAVALVIV
jgi:hypothetical protein